MPKRPKTPPQSIDEEYLAVVTPFPLNPNWEIQRDRIEFARWIAHAMGPENEHEHLFAFYYKPRSAMIILEVGKSYPSQDLKRRLLGQHEWSLFLASPSAEERGKQSKIFFCLYKTDRETQKHGWLRVMIDPSWFEKWDRSKFKTLYPATTRCNPPPEDPTNKAICRPLPVDTFPLKSIPPTSVVGSASWADDKDLPPVPPYTPLPSRGNAVQRARGRGLAPSAISHSRSSTAPASPPPLSPATRKSNSFGPKIVLGPTRAGQGPTAAQPPRGWDTPKTSETQSIPNSQWPAVSVASKVVPKATPAWTKPSPVLTKPTPVVRLPTTMTATQGRPPISLTSHTGTAATPSSSTTATRTSPVSSPSQKKKKKRQGLSKSGSPPPIARSQSSSTSRSTPFIPRARPLHHNQPASPPLEDTTLSAHLLALEVGSDSDSAESRPFDSAGSQVTSPSDPYRDVFSDTFEIPSLPGPLQGWASNAKANPPTTKQDDEHTSRTHPIPEPDHHLTGLAALPPKPAVLVCSLHEVVCSRAVCAVYAKEYKEAQREARKLAELDESGKSGSGGKRNRGRKKGRGKKREDLQGGVQGNQRTKSSVLSSSPGSRRHGGGQNASRSPKGSTDGRVAGAPSAPAPAPDPWGDGEKEYDAPPPGEDVYGDIWSDSDDG